MYLTLLLQQSILAYLLLLLCFPSLFSFTSPPPPLPFPFILQFDAEGAFESAFLMLGAAMRMATAGVQQVRASSVLPTPICVCTPWVLLAVILFGILFFGYLLVRESICVGQGLCWM